MRFATDATLKMLENITRNVFCTVSRQFQYKFSCILYLFSFFFSIMGCAVCARHAVHLLRPYYIVIVFVEEKCLQEKYGITAGVNIK